MSKLINNEWKKHIEETGQEVTRMTASMNRKLAVTTIRDAGASREDQTLLARHMAHTVKTDDRYYDQSEQMKGRHDVLNTIQQKYKASSKFNTSNNNTSW